MTDEPVQQTTFNWQGETAVCIDPRQEAKKKTIPELTPDDTIYRADEFFPKIPSTYPERPEPRTYTHSVYADAKIHRALRKLGKSHDMMRATIRYLMFKVGVIQLRMAYETEFKTITGIINEIDDNPQTEGGVDAIPEWGISQTGGYIKELRSGFTHSDHDYINELSENLGLKTSSFLVVAFWMIVIKCDYLPDDLKQYGQGIIVQFEGHLKMRIRILEQIHGGV